MLMNRAMPRRPPDNSEYPGGPPAAAQPEKTADAPVQDQSGVSSPSDMGGPDFGPLPMPPMPAMPPGSNGPLAVPGFQSGPAPGGRSMMGAPPPGMDMFGGGDGGPGGDAGDGELMRRILAGLPQGG